MKFLRPTLAAAIALALPACAAAQVTPSFVTAQTEDFRQRPVTDEVIYFVLPDRFANADPDNDFGGYEQDRLVSGYDPGHKGFYHGGDLGGADAEAGLHPGTGGHRHLVRTDLQEQAGTRSARRRKCGLSRVTG